MLIHPKNLAIIFCLSFLMVLMSANAQSPNDKIIELDQRQENIKILGDDDNDQSGNAVSSGYIDSNGHDNEINTANCAEQQVGDDTDETYVIFDSNSPVAANFPISVANDDQDNVAIAYNSTSKTYLVVWIDERDVATTGYYYIYGQIIRYDGSLQGSNFPIASADFLPFSMPAVAANPTNNNFLLVWEQDSDIYGQFVSGNGSIIGTNFLISTSSLNHDPEVAYNSNSNNFLVVYENFSESAVYGQLVNNVGGLIGSQFQISTSGNPDTPSIVYNSTNNNYLVVWGWEDIYAQLVNSIGGLIGSNFVAIDTSDYEHEPEVKYNSKDNNFLVISYNTKTKGQLVSNTGTLIGTTFLIADNAWWEGGAAYNNFDNNYLVVWYKSTDIYGKILNSDGSADSLIFPISTAINSQIYPETIFDHVHNSFLVVWEDCRNSSSTGRDIYGSFIIMDALITGQGPGASSCVRNFSSANGALMKTWQGFGAGNTNGEVSVAKGDVNCDGITEIVVGQRSMGASSYVRVFTNDGTLLWGFQAFGNANTNGMVNVAVGDVDLDGVGEIVVGQGPGGNSYVRIFEYGNPSPVTTWKAFGGGNVSGEVRVAGGHTAPGVSTGQIITGQGHDGQSCVRVWDYGSPPTLRSTFQAFGGANTSGGVDVGVGCFDAHSSGRDLIAVGQGGPGQTAVGPADSYVRIFTGGGALLKTIKAFGASNTKGRVTVSGGQADSDIADEIIVGQAVGGNSYFRIFNYNGSLIIGVKAFGGSNTSGQVDVAGCKVNSDGSSTMNNRPKRRY